ncbi:hypothetical protein GR140_19185 [Pseudomonas putida]|uniref:hypothetical protein n=1 Tax=Pseudomonas putida TaxID=303 RepID=UPI001BAFDB18|nr:hypothetical protein [Pseudomonas putida]QUG90791.1 hypothetical protein GR140_19185 [Pseudomonas putida]
MRKISPEKYETSVTETLNKVLTENSKYLTESLRDEGEKINFAPVAFDLFKDLIPSELLEKITIDREPKNDYQDKQIFIHSERKDSDGNTHIISYDEDHGLVSIRSYCDYLTNNRGTKTYGEYLKLSLKAYKLMIANEIGCYYDLVSKKDYNGIDDARQQFGLPKKNIMQLLGYIAWTTENHSEEELILKLAYVNYRKIVSRVYAFTPEGLCNHLGIKQIKITKIDTGFKVFFQSNKGFYYLNIKAEIEPYAYYCFDTPIQSFSRAYREIDDGNEMHFRKRNEQAMVIDGIELSEQGFNNLDSVYDCKTINTQKPTSVFKKIWNTLTFADYKTIIRLYGALIVWGIPIQLLIRLTNLI